MFLMSDIILSIGESLYLALMESIGQEQPFEAAGQRNGGDLTVN